MRLPPLPPTSSRTYGSGCGPYRNHGFPGLGGQGVAVASVAMKVAAGPIETMVPAARVQLSRAGGQAVCFLEALCTKVRHAQRSKEVGGFKSRGQSQNILRQIICKEVVQSTLLNFSSESGPSGNVRDFQISRKLCRLLQGIGEDTLGNSRHQNSSFQIDHRAFMSQLGVCRWLSAGLQFFENCLSEM